MSASFLRNLIRGMAFLAAIACGMNEGGTSYMEIHRHARAGEAGNESSSPGLVLFLGGDVMTGRGIDQVLPYPANPRLYEPYVKSAGQYVLLAQQRNGDFSYPVDLTYIWGDALKEWKLRSPDLKLINLETSVTSSDDFWKDKGIHYRMHPKNAPVLKEAGIDFCSLANNHTLDWGYAGLRETLETLNSIHVKVAGAGRNLQEAGAPAVFGIAGKGRVLVFAFGFESSGIPVDWAATDQSPGVNLFSDLSKKTMQRIITHVQKTSRPEDVTVASIHWGGNWGYEIPAQHIEFAHRLIDEAGVDVIHGHSSHHVQGIEVHKGKLVLYGCGDFLNDYEGIEGFEEYRGDLSLMYFASLNPADGSLIELKMIPVTMKRFQVTYPEREDSLRLRDTLNREGKRFATRVEFIEKDHSLLLLPEDNR